MLPYVYIVVPMYGVFCALGVIAALVILYPRAKKYGVSVMHTVQVCIFMIIGMILGSKILFLLTQLDTLISNFSVELLAERFITGGFVFYGGLFGALIGIWLYVAIRKFDKKALFNMFTPCIPMFHAFGRIGCMMSGCCYGIEFPWGIEMATSPGVVRFPVQLAESICDVFILIAILLIERKRSQNEALLPIYMISYAVCRFLLEFLRGDEIRGYFLCFSTSQWIALGVLVFYGIKIFILHNRKTESINEVRQEEKIQE